MKKVIIIALIFTMLLTTVVFSDTVIDTIEATINTIKVTLNGETIEADNLFYEGRTYVQLREVTNMIGAKLEWDAATKTANLDVDSVQAVSTSNPTKTVLLKGYTNPVISYSELGVDKDLIEGVLFKDLDEVSYTLEDDGLKWQTNLNLNSSQKITILLKDQTQANYTLKDSGLASIKQSFEPQIIFIPAQPELGFNFPYMIRIPGYSEPMRHDTSERYLSFDMINNGSWQTFEQCVQHVKLALTQKNQSSIQRAADLHYPIMMPIVQRTSSEVQMDGFGRSFLYEHALDRDSVYTRELTTTDSNASSNIKSFENDNVDYKLTYDLDEQIKAMMVHAIDYLNDNNFGLEDKVILDGYSASGTFTDRFANLHPEVVAMVVSGGTVDDMMLPTATYKGEALNFPVGINDYQKITEKAFDLEAHNGVARLVYMGKDDTNNTIPYSDCYFQNTTKQMVRLFGEPVLPRAQTNIELYGESGGKGMFILDQGIQHGSSNDMGDYCINFIVANANSLDIVYPKPKASNLEYTLYE